MAEFNFNTAATPAAFWQPGFNAGSQIGLGKSNLAQEAANNAARIQIQQQQLQQQADNAALAAEVRMRELEQAALEAQHRAAIEEAYKKASIQMDQMRIKEVQDANALNWMKESSKQKQQQGYSRAVAAGVPEYVAAQWYPGMYNTGGHLSAMARLKEEQKFVSEAPPVFESGTNQFFQSGPNRFEQIRPQPKEQRDMLSEDLVSEDIKNIRNIQKDIRENPNVDEDLKAQWTAEVEMEMKRVNNSLKAMGRKPAFPEAEGTGAQGLQIKNIRVISPGQGAQGSVPLPAVPQSALPPTGGIPMATAPSQASIPGPVAAPASPAQPRRPAPPPAAVVVSDKDIAKKVAAAKRVYPDAPSDPKKRVPGVTYMTSDGPLKWTEHPTKSGTYGWMVSPMDFFKSLFVGDRDKKYALQLFSGKDTPIPWVPGFDYSPDVSPNPAGY